MIMIIIMVMGSLTFLVSSLSKSGASIGRDKITAESLTQAKDALIAFAATVQLDNTCTGTNCARPGDLPCPDINNDGLADSPCGNASGSTGQSLRIGRLPWKTLGIPDLRDSSGERLWYAVSNNFKNNTRNTVLNSDTQGTISVYSATGILLNDGNSVAGTGAVAVVIAPGEVLAAQDRSNANINTPSNYLDSATVNGITHGNSSFVDGSSTDGFIQGRIKDANGNLVVNDQIVVVTQNDILKVIQKRVAKEVKNCLIEYASLSNGYLPWAARIRTTSAPSYLDFSGRLFGRIPYDFTNSVNDNGNLSDMWGPTCNTHNNNTESGWWINWKEMVFYGVADAYSPTPQGSTQTCTGGGACLIVNPPSTAANKQFVVIVAGEKLTGQNRVTNANKGTLSNYLEAPNPTSYLSPPNEPTSFSLGNYSSSFNDTVVFQ